MTLKNVLCLKLQRFWINAGKACLKMTMFRFVENNEEMISGCFKIFRIIICFEENSKKMPNISRYVLGTQLQVLGDFLDVASSTYSLLETLYGVIKQY
jgi:hypothetical protein